MHQDAVRTRDRDERDVRGQVRREERRPRRERCSRRQVESPRRIHLHPLRVPAATDRPRTDAPSVQFPGDLVPEDVRQLRHLRIEPAPDQHVGEVDAGRTHVEHRTRRFLPLLDHEVAADLAQHDRLHLPVQFAWRFSRNAATPSWPSSEARHAANACTSRWSLRASLVSWKSCLI